jgi:hypothetical protein
VERGGLFRPALPGSMLVHSVYFWLKPDLAPEQREKFRAALESLRGIPAVQEMFVGIPASTDRPVVDRTYSVALTVLLKDMEGHDAYQVHPLHKTFVTDFASYWIKVVIYDAQ